MAGLSERRFDFTFTGITPLLFHADDVEASDLLSEWRKDTTNKNFSVPGDDRSPPWTWQTYLYREHGQGPDGSLCWPSANIMVGLRWAGAQLILKRMKTFKEITQSGMGIETEFVDFLCRGEKIPMSAIEALRDLPFKDQADGVKELGFRLFMKRAVVGRAKHVRVRARFEDWQIRGQFVVWAAEITDDVLTQLCEISGRGGQGDWRAAGKTPGPFGRFRAEVKAAKRAKVA